MTESNINWDDPSEAMAAIVGQFKVTVARLFAQWDNDGRYDELVRGYREGRTSFALSKDGLTLLEDAPVPPPTSN